MSDKIEQFEKFFHQKTKQEEINNLQIALIGKHLDNLPTQIFEFQEKLLMKNKRLEEICSQFKE